MPQNQTISYFIARIKKNNSGGQHTNSRLLEPHFSGGRDDKSIDDLILRITAKTLQVMPVKTINTTDIREQNVHLNRG